MTNVPLPPQNRNMPPLPAARRRPYTPPAAPQMTRTLPQANAPLGRPLPPMPGAAIARPLPVRPTSKANRRKWLMIGAGLVGVMGLVMMLFVIGVMAIGPANLIYGSSIISSVRAGGVDVGRLSESNAADHIATAWTNVTLASPTSQRNIAPVSLSAAELGLTIDANASAERAFAEGRSQGSISSVFAALVDVPLSVQINADTARAALTAHANELSIAPVNAGVALVNGRVQPTAAQDGLAVDVNATIIQWMNSPILSFQNGTAYLAMTSVPASITDSSGLVSQAEALLTQSLDLRVYDPVTDDSAYWSVPPEQWGNWLTATSDPNSAIGLSLQLNDTDLREYLTNQTATALDSSRTIDIDQAVAAIQAALAAGTPDKGAIILKHLPRTHVVQAGETMMTIGYDYGLPYLYVEAVNPGVDTLSVGQVINIPPADEMLLLPVVPNKRIVVNISNQTLTAYENGTVKWDWKASTGLPSSPTWPGVYQVLEREEDAWGGQWSLNMPKFIGFYHPAPNLSLINGIHGFPTRNGGQLLWENSIGTPVTYGCVLLNTEHSQLLFDWAEEGTVVEVLP